jgi:hypothetical protein
VRKAALLAAAAVGLAGLVAWAAWCEDAERRYLARR